jgi:hypothetical protein
MIANHLINGLIFGASMSIISWIVGMVVNSMLAKTSYYDKLSDLQFFSEETLNKRMGIKYFRWLVKNTFFRFFNPGLKVPSRSVDFHQLRSSMTFSEISHLIGFVFVSLAALFQCFNVSLVFGLSMMIGNTLLNLYPSLLQQENKRRIDQMIKRYKIKTPKN